MAFRIEAWLSFKLLIIRNILRYRAFIFSMFVNAFQVISFYLIIFTRDPLACGHGLDLTRGTSVDVIERVRDDLVESMVSATVCPTRRNIFTIAEM